MSGPPERVDQLVLGHLRAPGDVRLLRAAVQLVLRQLRQLGGAPPPRHEAVSDHRGEGRDRQADQHASHLASSRARRSPVPGTRAAKTGREAEIRAGRAAAAARLAMPPIRALQERSTPVETPWSPDSGTPDG